MTGKQVLKKVEEVRKIAEEKERCKALSKKKKQTEREMFYRCKEECICNESPCCALRLQQCPSCNDVLKSTCSKLKCRNENGSKPSMIRAESRKKPCNRNLFELVNSDYSDEEMIEDDYGSFKEDKDNDCLDIDDVVLNE